MKAFLVAALAVLLLSGCASTTETTDVKTTEFKNTTPEYTEFTQEIPEVKPKTSAELLAEAQTELDDGYSQSAKKILDALIIDYPEASEVAAAKKMIAAIDKNSEKENVELAKEAAKAEKEARDLEKAIRANYGNETDINSGKMTAAIFADLSEGMTIDEVAKLVGGPGELSSEGYGTAIYSYEGVGSIGANALITFTDGKLVSKAQAGLE